MAKPLSSTLNGLLLLPQIPSSLYLDLHRLSSIRPVHSSTDIFTVNELVHSRWVMPSDRKRRRMVYLRLNVKNLSAIESTSILDQIDGFLELFVHAILSDDVPTLAGQADRDLAIIFATSLYKGLVADVAFAIMWVIGEGRQLHDQEDKHHGIARYADLHLTSRLAVD
ncbi:hypothetical protein BJ878DRAFT_307785 [Calycina marina]|uniref:Uncharacterized protein n=1 Tax=Calycina marina TaxID=1763456 RepID=A0A9P7Z680_9HELO|nr:hypothetical protein BJ878DRAFT_307785 [Calycina marina]